MADGVVQDGGWIELRGDRWSRITNSSVAQLLNLQYVNITTMAGFSVHDRGADAVAAQPLLEFKLEVSPYPPNYDHQPREEAALMLQLPEVPLETCSSPNARPRSRSRTRQA